MKHTYLSWMILSAVLLLIHTQATATGKTFTVTNLNNSGAGSLRAAIDSVNANNTNSANKHSIVFSSSLASPYTITLSSVLPAITEPVVINGTISGSNYAKLNGNTQNFAGLTLRADYITVKKLNFKKFNGGTSASGIKIDSAYALIDSVRIDTCYMGVHIIAASSYACIKHSTIYRIENNGSSGGYGIYIAGDNVEVKEGNRIANTNKTAYGIYMLSSTQNAIIGQSITTGTDMNVIEGFLSGIYITGTAATAKIYGNLIGGPSKLESSGC